MHDTTYHTFARNTDRYNTYSSRGNTGLVHEHLGITISSFQFSFVLLVIFTAPIIAIIIILFARNIQLRVGCWSLFLSFLGSLISGIVYHTVVPGSDNMFTIMGEQEAFIFQSTSILLVIVDASGCVIAAKASERLFKCFNCYNEITGAA